MDGEHRPLDVGALLKRRPTGVKHWSSRELPEQQQVVVAPLFRYRRQRRHGDRPMLIAWLENSLMVGRSDGRTDGELVRR